MSTPDANQIRSLDELRRFVHRVLCEKENILAEQFDLSESVLIRCGKSCGRQFSVCGPRSIRLNNSQKSRPSRSTQYGFGMS